MRRQLAVCWIPVAWQQELHDCCAELWHDLPHASWAHAFVAMYAALTGHEQDAEAIAWIALPSV